MICLTLHITVSSHIQLCLRFDLNLSKDCLFLCAFFEYGVPQSYFTELFTDSFCFWWGVVTPIGITCSLHHTLKLQSTFVWEHDHPINLTNHWHFSSISIQTKDFCNEIMFAIQLGANKLAYKMLLVCDTIILREIILCVTCIYPYV